MNNLKKEQIINYLIEDEIPEESLKDLLDAKYWSNEKKEDFVNFITEGLQWLSYQNDIENIHRLKMQYNLYLIVINE